MAAAEAPKGVMGKVGDQKVRRTRDERTGASTYHYEDGSTKSDDDLKASGGEWLMSGGSETAIKSGVRNTYDPRTGHTTPSTIMQNKPDSAIGKADLGAAARANAKPTPTPTPEEKERKKKNQTSALSKTSYNG